MKDFNLWNNKKYELEGKSMEGLFFYEREIWWCSIGLNIGHEEDGKNEWFERPVLVIKKFNQHVFFGIPLSSQEKENRYYVPLVYEGGNGQAMISQMKLFSSKRLSRKVGTLSVEEYEKIRRAFKSIL